MNTSCGWEGKGKYSSFRLWMKRRMCRQNCYPLTMRAISERLRDASCVCRRYRPTNRLPLPFTFSKRDHDQVEAPMVTTIRSLYCPQQNVVNESLDNHSGTRGHPSYSLVTLTFTLKFQSPTKCQNAMHFCLLGETHWAMPKGRFFVVRIGNSIAQQSFA